jgi:hypothetical protein
VSSLNCGFCKSEIVLEKTWFLIGHGRCNFHIACLNKTFQKAVGSIDCPSCSDPNFCPKLECRASRQLADESLLLENYQSSISKILIKRELDSAPFDQLPLATQRAIGEEKLKMLVHAIFLNQQEAVQSYLNDESVPSQKFEHALTWGACMGLHQMIDDLFTNEMAKKEALDFITPFRFAIIAGDHHKAVKALLQYDEKLTSEDFGTLLKLAVLAKRTRVVQTFLKETKILSSETFKRHFWLKASIQMGDWEKFRECLLQAMEIPQSLPKDEIISTASSESQLFDSILAGDKVAVSDLLKSCKFSKRVLKSAILIADLEEKLDIVSILRAGGQLGGKSRR